MKIFHIVCTVLMIAMMQHTCFADEQTEIIYGDGWTEIIYGDGHREHKLAPNNYLRWDGEWRPKNEMNLSSGDWPYMVEEFETYYLITRLDNSLNLSKNYRTYDFQPYKIGVQLTLTPIQLNEISTPAGDYWYIVIPQSLKETATKHLKWDNKLPTIYNKSGFVLNQTDNVSGEIIPNYEYHNISGELRLYYNQVARSFGITSTEITFDFNSYVINGSTGWANTSYDSNITHVQSTGNIELQDAVPDYISRWRMDEGTGTTVHDENTTSGNDGTIYGSAVWGNDHLIFDRVGDYIVVPYSSTLDFDYDWTLSAQSNTSDGMNTMTVFVKNWWPDRNYQMYINEAGDDKEYICYNSGASFHRLPSTVTITDGIEHHLVGTFNDIDNSLTNFVDGNDVSGTQTGYGEPDITTGDLYIGTSDTTTDFMNGTLRDIRAYNRILSATEINQIRDNHHKTTGNITHWHDASTGYQTASFIVNMTTPTNTNYTVWYADNGSSFTQIGGTYTGNQTPSISGTKYQNTDLRIVMNGNSTATPEEIEVTFVTDASAAGAAPNITSWQNNKTSNDSFDITINTSEEVNFNATANQTITTWKWDVNLSHNYDNITYSWMSAGLKYINVNATNANGTSSTITWNVTVLDTEPEPTPTLTPAPAISISPTHYDELDLPLILYILMISLLYLLIAFRHGVAAVGLSLIYLIFAFFFLLFQTVTMSVNYIYLTLFLLLFIISIAGITKQGAD